MSAETSKKPAKVGMIETFLSGAKKGWGIAINTIMPAMVLGYVLVQVFNVTGVMNSFPEGVITTCTSAPALTKSLSNDTDL